MFDIYLGICFHIQIGFRASDVLMLTDTSPATHIRAHISIFLFVCLSDTFSWRQRAHLLFYGVWFNTMYYIPGREQNNTSVRSLVCLFVPLSISWQCVPSEKREHHVYWNAEVKYKTKQSFTFFSQRKKTCCVQWKVSNMEEGHLFSQLCLFTTTFLKIKDFPRWHRRKLFVALLSEETGESGENVWPDDHTPFVAQKKQDGIGERQVRYQQACWTAN